MKPELCQCNKILDPLLGYRRGLGYNDLPIEVNKCICDFFNDKVGCGEDLKTNLKLYKLFSIKRDHN